MKLFYKSGACSMASHIVLHEIGRAFETEAVDTAAGRTASGADYRAINPKGYVPALVADDGQILTEGAAILEHLAESAPAAGLAPAAGTMARSRMREHLIFTASELHKAFGPLFRQDTSEAGKAAARHAVALRFDHVEAQIADGRAHLLGEGFTVADAYLFVVASWANVTGIDLARWPHLSAYVARVGARPAAQAALKAEGLAA